MSLFHHYHQIVKKTIIVIMEIYASMVAAFQNASLDVKGINCASSMDAWKKLAAKMIKIAHTLTGVPKAVVFPK